MEVVNLVTAMPAVGDHANLQNNPVPFTWNCEWVRVFAPLDKIESVLSDV